MTATMTATTISADAVSFVCSIVRDRSAIELEESKGYLIEARLAALAKQQGLASPAELIRQVRTAQQPKLEQRLVEAMTTNETSFFRDHHPFEALRTVILPELLARNASRRTLNIWSAACSTGQELYSIAMLLREGFPELLNWNVQLVGTDLADEVLDRARAARFSQIEVNRGLPATLLMKYFRREGNSWCMIPEIAAAARFSKLNLIGAWPALPAFDLVFLRNVLIYFAPETKRKILQRLHHAIAPGGVLFLGAAETTMGLETMYVREQSGHAVFYRTK
jgi:chemotaxis protein methyltransferase CheR